MKRATNLNYFFIWGNYPALSLAEVLTTLKRWHIPAQVIDASVEAGVIETHQYLPEVFIHQLGGTIKMGRIIGTFEKKMFEGDVLGTILMEKRAKKILFGLSQYRLHNFSVLFSEQEFLYLGKSIKKYIREHGYTVRWVTSKTQNLSAVVVKKNKLIEKGGEFALLHAKEHITVGTTTAVQPFEAYSTRDYGRVSVDPKRGMLPLKLAHIMLNLSETNSREIILDPFCGSGTILQEALVMGWSHVVGSDTSKKAIHDTNQNMTWIKRRYGLRSSVVRLFHADARNLSHHLRGSYIASIVTEPYLGPALSTRIGKNRVQKIKDELEALYLLAFIDFTKYLRKGGRVVIVFPVFIVSKARGGLIFINLFKKLEEQGFKLLRPLHKECVHYKLGGLTPRGTFIYGRPHQKVWREIVSFGYKT